MDSNETRKHAEDEIIKLKEEIARTQYVDEIRQREFYNALVLKNNKPEYFHTITEKVRDDEVIPSFQLTRTRNYEDYFNTDHANEEMEDILTNDAFFIRGNNFEEQNINKASKQKGKEGGICLDDVEIYKANEFRLEALETGNPRDELERLDRELFSFFKKKDEGEINDEDERYHRLVDPLLDKIKYPERYDKNANQYF